MPPKLPDTQPFSFDSVSGFWCLISLANTGTPIHVIISKIIIRAENYSEVRNALQCLIKWNDNASN